MMTVLKRFHGLSGLLGVRRRMGLRKAYYFIKAEMAADLDFYDRYWGTEISDAVWKALIREALSK